MPDAVRLVVVFIDRHAESIGIDAGYINEMNASRSEKLSIRDLIRLKSAGIDAGYLDKWSERN